MANRSGTRLRSTRPNSALIFLAVVVVGLTILAQSGAGQSSLSRLGVVSPSQRYTELAFVGAQHLPTRLPRAPTRLRLAFTITNREGRAKRYGWTIFERMGATETHQLMTGETSLGESRQAYLDPAVTFHCTSDQANVDVRLSSGEVIDFIVQCSGPLSNPEILETVVHALAAAWLPPAAESQRWLQRALRSLLAGWRTSTGLRR